MVLGLGTVLRLVMECYHERAVQRNIRQMELLNADPEPAQAQAEAATDEPTEQVLMLFFLFPEARALPSTCYVLKLRLTIFVAYVAGSTTSPCMSHRI